MTGLQRFWNLVFGFDPIKGIQILDLDFKAILFQILSPVIAAASSGQFVNRDQPFLGLISRASTGRQGQDQQHAQGNPSFHLTHLQTTNKLD
jgi:hypothetical protein